ncbi:MAG: ribonuclease P protein component [bacterium]|nr:ribonuclease P protein component [bacterium]
MLAYKNRFHGHGSLRYVYAKGDAVRTQKIVVKFTPNSRRKDSRFAVVVSKKVLKSAVGRNRIRRRVYEIIRHELPEIEGVFDVAVMVFHKSVREMPHEELRDSIKEIFSEAGFYCKK